ncbi:basic helix-loop-helix (bHLH) DNA-bindingsuperfamily protein [Striga asiatica]|uniref:Basic helix-loop-helix (BHLH) DNA-bindingsuperfamily protein n=1 Tax=Striga asiatica TaxID=4170 RepID=A0A5A7Q7B4_STRAF|nr:basic helix-loop-helix (bHLH) DNA-bindingsuperfamily protein [Striga asiatica]
MDTEFPTSLPHPSTTLRLPLPSTPAVSNPHYTLAKYSELIANITISPPQTSPPFRPEHTSTPLQLPLSSTLTTINPHSTLVKDTELMANISQSPPHTSPPIHSDHTSSYKKPTSPTSSPKANPTINASKWKRKNPIKTTENPSLPIATRTKRHLVKGGISRSLRNTSRREKQLLY